MQAIDIKKMLPTFDDFLKPILKHASDRKPHDLGETVSAMAEELQIPMEAREILLPDGRRTYLYNRVQWATTYLSQAGLVERAGRGRYHITNMGLEELGNFPDNAKWNYLLKFESFRQFKQRLTSNKVGLVDKSKVNSVPTNFADSPDITITELIKMKEEALSKELLSQLRRVTPSYFERLIIDVMLSLGYGKDFEDMAKVLGKSGDDGIDGEIPQDRLGFEKIYLQAKRWSDNNVGSREINGFIGSLTRKHARKGVFITSSSFTKDARRAAEEDTDHKIVLIDGEELAGIMIEKEVGVRKSRSYVVKEIDNDYFDESEA